MSTTTSVALSQQMALQRNMDVIANNLANTNTTAFKAESLLFEEHLMDVSTSSGNHKISYVIDNGVDRNLSEGHQVMTGNPLDFAIRGEGYFVVDVNGEERFTRNGHFVLDDQGQLSTKEGYLILAKGGGPITLSPQDGEIFVSADGTISTDQGQKGQIDLVTFENEMSLIKEGDSLFRTDDAPEAAETPHIVQGAIETSNVSPVLEMTKMIDVMRAYQSAAKLVDTNNKLALEAISTLSGTK